MTRKDSEKDSERPHYYSQFWLDVAAGRRIIGAPKGDEAEIMEPEVAESVAPARRVIPGRATDDDFDDNAQDDEYSEPIAHPVVTPDDIIEAPDVAIEPKDPGDLDIENGEMEDIDVPDMDLSPINEEEEEQEEEFFEEEEEEEEEEEDDIGWTRGRKKPSPKRPTKQPPAKKPKREPRRGF